MKERKPGLCLVALLLTAARLYSAFEMLFCDWLPNMLLGSLLLPGFRLLLVLYQRPSCGEVACVDNEIYVDEVNLYDWAFKMFKHSSCSVHLLVH